MILYARTEGWPDGNWSPSGISHAFGKRWVPQVNAFHLKGHGVTPLGDFRRCDPGELDAGYCISEIFLSGIGRTNVIF